MALYEYLCADAKGQQKRGTMEAADPSDLKGALAMQGLLVISWHLYGSAPESPKVPKDPTADKLTPPVTPKDEIATPENDHNELGKETSEESLRKFYSEKDLTKFQKVMAFLRTTTGLALLAFFLLVAAAGDYYFLTIVNPFKPQADPNSLSSKIRAIHPGMERQEVEAFLRRQGGLHPSSNTRYLAGPSVWVTISFDADGGPWNPHNRVIGTPHFETRVTD